MSLPYTKVGSIPQFRPVGVVFLLGILWLDFVWVFQREWSYNEQYSYGWLTPFLLLYLLYTRNGDRPVPSPPPKPGLPLLIAGLLLLFPLRVVLGANPEWSLPLWGYAVTVFALTLILLRNLGGRTWVWHFGSAFALMLFAVPWPTFLEIPVTAGLMGLIAGIVVESMNLLGIYAEQSGNLIRLRNGWVGIEEACSGVRNFQSTIMSAWFIGELFRFSVSGRALLLILGGLASLILNLGRSWILTWTTHSQGTSLTETLHDPVGHVVSAIAFAVLLLVAFGLRRWFTRETAKDHATNAPEGPPQPQKGGTGPLSPRLCAALALLLVAGHATTWTWYFRTEQALPTPRKAELAWDSLGFTPEFVEIAPAIRAQLRYAEGAQAEWAEAMGHVRWTVFDFAWQSGSISPFVGVHSPQTCLPASGYQLESTHAPLRFALDEGHTIEFSATTFRFLSKPYQVYYATWEDHWGAEVPFVETAADRLLLAWEGRRITHKRSLQIVIEGVQDEETARGMAESFLRTALRWKT